MAAGKTTHAIDRITAKSSGLTLIVCDVNLGNTTDVPLTSVPMNGYITRKQFNSNASGTPPVQTFFTTSTGVTINWQTDIAPNYSVSYAALLGNTFPKPMVYALTGTLSYTWLSSVNIIVNYDTDSNITTVVFDWGDSQTGTIQF